MSSRRFQMGRRAIASSVALHGDGDAGGRCSRISREPRRRRSSSAEVPVDLLRHDMGISEEWALDIQRSVA